MSFYRKYRPQVIADIDTAHVREPLLSLMSRDRADLPHAYFFTGPKGTGKTTAARVIAKLFNCTKVSKKNGPCGSCEQCSAIAKGVSIDVVEMDAASNRGIDEIRQLRERIGLAPVSASHTVYIIDEVHMLTTEAFNALLKTLEEPPQHAVFVLATTDAHKVPATIKSRCMEVNFRRASAAELLSALTRVARGEGIKADDAALAMIAQASEGSFRDAVKLLEQISLSSKTITESAITAVLPGIGHERLGEFVTPLGKKDASATLDAVARLIEHGADMRAFVTAVLQWLEQDLIRGIKEPGSSRFGTGSEIREAIRLLSRAYEDMRYSPLPQLPVELAVIEYCLPDRPAQESAAVQRESVPVPPPTAPKKPVKPPPSGPESGGEPTADAPALPVKPLGLLTYEKLVEHWPDFIIAMKPFNHSVAGVLRSSRPKAVDGGIVTIEAFYKFHQEKLGDARTRQSLADVLKRLFGETVKVEIVLGNK